MLKFVRSSIVLGLGLALGSMSCAENKKPMANMDSAAMMAEMAKSSQPGPEHQRLMDFAGTWDATVQSWMPDGTACGTSKGTMQTKMILDGRFLQLNYEGDMTPPGGQTMHFTGMGLSGYDKGKGKYTNVWVDTMSTGMMTTEGTATGDTITCEGGFTCPMTHQFLKVKEIDTKVDKDHFTFEMHNSTPDGKMYKCMEIKYTRKM